MATAIAFAFVELDTNATIVEAAAKRIHLAFHQGSVVARTAGACFYLARAQRMSHKVREALSQAVVETPEQRMAMRVIATSLGEAARALDHAYRDASKRNLVKVPVFGQTLMSQLEDLSCAVEDIAETAAFAADEAFATSVCDELRRNIEEHHNCHAIA